MITWDPSWSYADHSIRQAYIVVSIIIDRCCNARFNIIRNWDCISFGRCSIGGKLSIISYVIDSATQWDPGCIRTYLITGYAIYYAKFVPP